jgi:hypothetical protein
MLYCAFPDALEVARLHPCKSFQGKELKKFKNKKAKQLFLK